VSPTRTPANLTGSYGTFSFDAATGAWGYSLNNAAANVQALTAADTRTDTLNVTSLDGSASQALVVTVHGADEPGIVGRPSQFLVGGSNGSDHITIGPSNILVDAKAGDDTISLLRGGPFQLHFLNGGAGSDTLDLSATTSGAIVNLAFGYAIGEPIQIARSSRPRCVSARCAWC
jgi:VCBS repeat-containing protein